MASKTRNLYLFFLFICLFIVQVTYAQKNTNPINKADSLFRESAYSASYSIYANILKSDQKYSPQMLLKLAYIQESQNNFKEALYYLHLYYAKTSDRTVLKKMESLANRQNYIGYEYSDLDIFRSLFNKYYMAILQGLLMLAVVTIIILIRSKLRNKIPGHAFQMFFIAYLAFIGYYINMLNLNQEGIIWQNNAAIMTAPSAGATWLATVSSGHKINIKGERDIWYETEWNGRQAYIRKKNVLALP